jgi:4-amino-4-deoxy-L-arabinose transferase-like glycosyltransferase
VLLREPDECSVVLTRRRRESRLVDFLSRFQHHAPPSGAGIINARMAIRHRFLLAASFIYLAAANLIWIARDTRPPFWDMAFHQTAALRIHDAFSTFGIRAFAIVPFLSGFYPPLYHSIVGVFYSLFGKTSDAAEWANLPALAILIAATYGVGRTLLKPLPAAAAAMLVGFFPYLIWLSRETLVDYWLTAMVALAMWALIRTQEFSNRNASIAFGIVCGLGLLTKWTFPLFVVLPSAWLARKNLKNASIAAGVAAVMAAFWYLPAGRSLQQLAEINNAGALSEGDPGRLSFQALVFYARALEGYQLFLPLFLVFIAGAIILARKFDRAWIPIVLWLIGGWLGLMLFQNKDPRYSAPLLPAVALISARAFEKRNAFVALLMPVLLFQHYLVSFGIRQLPPTAVLFRGVQGTLSWDWNIYRQNYFELWGPPAREDWQVERVLAKVTAGNTRTVKLGMIPDIPRFDWGAFQFYITLAKLPVIFNRIVFFDESIISNNDYILMSENDQGWASNVSSDLKKINEYILDRPDHFHIIDSFALPNGDMIRLYKVGSS